MSQEKVVDLINKCTQILREQGDTISEVQLQLSQVGRDLEDFLSSGFRKNFRSLMFSVDIEKYSNNTAALLSEVDSMINEVKSAENKMSDAVRDILLGSLVRQKESLIRHMELINFFKDAALEMQEGLQPDGRFFKRESSGQKKMLQDYIRGGLKDAMYPMSRLEQREMKQEINNVCSMNHLEILARFNKNEIKINPFIRMILQGFVERKVEQCRMEVQRTRMKFSDMQTRFEENVAAADAETRVVRGMHAH